MREKKIGNENDAQVAAAGHNHPGGLAELQRSTDCMGHGVLDRAAVGCWVLAARSCARHNVSERGNGIRPNALHTSWLVAWRHQNLCHRRVTNPPPHAVTESRAWPHTPRANMQEGLNIVRRAWPLHRRTELPRCGTWNTTLACS